MNQRFFSTFPLGRSGIAVALLSLVLGAPALAQQGNQQARINELIEVLGIESDQEADFRAAMARVQAVNRGQGQRSADSGGRIQRQEGDNASERGQEMRQRGQQQAERARGQGREGRGERQEQGSETRTERQGQGGGQMQGRQQMMARQQRADEILSEVLDDEQMARFRAWRSERMQERQDNNNDDGDEHAHH